MIGEKRALYIYTTIALALEFSIWFARNLVGNAVVVAIVGVRGPLVSQAVPHTDHRSSCSF